MEDAGKHARLKYPPDVRAIRCDAFLMHALQDALKERSSPFGFYESPGRGSLRGGFGGRMQRVLPFSTRRPPDDPLLGPVTTDDEVIEAREQERPEAAAILVRVAEELLFQDLVGNKGLEKIGRDVLGVAADDPKVGSQGRLVVRRGERVKPRAAPVRRQRRRGE